MASVTAIREGILTLTTDPDLRAKLVRKHAEYQQRYGQRAPESDPDGYYKLQMLGELLTNGIIDFEAKEQEYALYAWHQTREFRSVVAVIRHYNGGQDDAIFGGTGLK